MDHGEMNAPALRFITFIQTHQPVYLQASTSTHLEIAIVIFFHYVNDIFSVFFFLPPLIFANACVVTLYIPILNCVFIVRK